MPKMIIHCTTMELKQHLALAANSKLKWLSVCNRRSLTKIKLKSCHFLSS